MKDTLDFDKAHYNLLKKRAKITGVGGVQYTVDPDCGMVFAWFTPHPESRNIHITWSVCSTADKFSKKVGKYHALRRLESGISLPLPINWDEGDSTAEEFIANFADSVFAALSPND